MHLQGGGRLFPRGGNSKFGGEEDRLALSACSSATTVVPSVSALASPPVAEEDIVMQRFELFHGASDFGGASTQTTPGGRERDSRCNCGRLRPRSALHQNTPCAQELLTAGSVASEVKPGRIAESGTLR